MKKKLSNNSATKNSAQKIDFTGGGSSITGWVVSVGILSVFSEEAKGD